MQGLYNEPDWNCPFIQRLNSVFDYLKTGETLTIIDYHIYGVYVYIHFNGFNAAKDKAFELEERSNCSSCKWYITVFPTDKSTLDHAVTLIVKAILNTDTRLSDGHGGMYMFTEKFRYSPDTIYDWGIHKNNSDVYDRIKSELE